MKTKMFFSEIDRKMLLMKIHYFVGIGGYGSFSPFISTISKQRGYSAFAVGLMLTLQPIPALIIRPMMGAITDKYKCRRAVFIGSSVITFVLVCLLSVIPGTTSNAEMSDSDTLESPLFWLFFTVTALINADGSVKKILEDTICMELLGENKHNYGKQRLWGSIGWSLFAVLAGVCVDWISEGQEFKNYTPGFIISITLFLIDIYVVTKIKVIQSSDTQIIVSDVKQVISNGKVLTFLLWVVTFGFFMSFIWYFVFWYLEDLSNLYHPETLPHMKTLQGFALIIQCLLGEVPSFFLSSLVLQRVNHMTVFSMMFFAFFLIFTAYSFIRDPLWALPVEVLNGLTFALPHSAAISYAAIIAPVGAEGTLQGIVGTAMSGIGAPIGSFIGGIMFKNFGSIASFKILSLAAFITCFTQIVVNKLINRISKNDEVKLYEYKQF